jgi:hypothetical protein
MKKLILLTALCLLTVSHQALADPCKPEQLQRGCQTELRNIGKAWREVWFCICPRASLPPPPQENRSRHEGQRNRG